MSLLLFIKLVFAQLLFGVEAHHSMVKDFLRDHEQEILQGLYDPSELATKSLEYFLTHQLTVRDSRELSCQIEKNYQVQQQVSI